MENKVPITNEEVENICKTTSEDVTKDFMFQQTMYRIKDPKASLAFYSDVLGMKLLQKLDFPSMKFSLFFMGYESPDGHGELGSSERSEWALAQKATLELTYNWGSEKDHSCKYHTGNSDPRGYGHIGIMVPDVDKACERFETLGVNFIKRPNDGRMRGIAFITDPDGYWIEILNNKTVADLNIS